MISLLHYAIGSVLLGVLLAFITVVVMFVLIKLWYNRAECKPVSYIVGLVLFFFLFIQFSLLCGAVKAKGCCEDAMLLISRAATNAYPASYEFDEESSLSVQEYAENLFPMIGMYLGDKRFDSVGCTPATIAEAFNEACQERLNEYIIYRVLWIVGLFIVAVVVVIKTISISNKVTKYVADYDTFKDDF